MITAKELRQKYLDFFEKKGHVVIPSASLIPENDPSILFTTAGMHPLVPFLLGEKHPAGKRLTNVQKSVRTGDIDEVGDIGHLTFFEMLGNWSLGDYFKKEAIAMSLEFLTEKKWLGLDSRKLAVSVFAGDTDAPRDKESAKYWQAVGVPKHKIAYLPKENNWWGLTKGPCGPDTEMFYWLGQTEYPPEASNPGNDEANWLEIWNDVFMQYFKEVDGSYQPLAQKNVDTGMGLERTLAVLNNLDDVYQIDTLWPIVEELEKISGKKYGKDQSITISLRIISDHLRSATMIMGDTMGIGPGNLDQGYVVRRLIRLAIRHGKKIGIEDYFCTRIARVVVDIFKDVYPEVLKNQNFVLTEMENEEDKFKATLGQGIRKFNKLENISAKEAFDLYQSYGFPLEMTRELAEEKGLQVDVEGFKKEFVKHQDISRQGAEQKFKGGLAGHGEREIKYHTATHLLQAALHKVLGEHVQQKGSNITSDRLRFDFVHPDKLTSEQKQEVENLVNRAIVRDLPVSCEEMSVAEAKAKGSIGLFEDKYGEKVKVYTIGSGDEVFSKEICGGPHVAHTGILGHFKIKKEESSSAGIRRIKAILE